ncbi:MAG: hypothetical protein LQ349_004259 [Xanthoria aureola]|nr:MAG: hypothetical protein LQ349_004259 [Xanthoria aureola]
MLANTESKHPEVDAILAKLPKEALAICTTYMQVKPIWEVKQAWQVHVLRLADFAHNRGAHVSGLASTIISPDHHDYFSSECRNLDTKLITIDSALEIAPRLAALQKVELGLAKRKDKVKVLEAERALGDDASRNLEWEIRIVREGASRWESAVKIHSCCTLRLATSLGLIVPTS